MKKQLINPVPTSTIKNNGTYRGDSGIDILVPKGTPVVAAADGVIIYSENGHTPWGTKKYIGIDTPGSILIRLDKPFEHPTSKSSNKIYPYIWYTHLSGLAHNFPPKWNVTKEMCDGTGESIERIVKAGDYLGKTGLGNRVPHLHFGVPVDFSQSDWVDPFFLADYIFSGDIEEEDNRGSNKLKLFVNKNGKTIILNGDDKSLGFLKVTLDGKSISPSSLVIEWD